MEVIRPSTTGSPNVGQPTHDKVAKKIKWDKFVKVGPATSFRRSHDRCNVLSGHARHGVQV